MGNPRKIFILSGFIGALSALLVVFISSWVVGSKPSKADNEAYLQHVNDKYRIYSLPLPESANFCGEPAPLDQWDVAEKMDRELLVNTYWHSNTLLSIKRSYRWFPIIEPILKEEGVPDDFKYLSLIESGYVNAVSPSGAVGFWQFLPETGKQYGLEINEEVDERYHVEKSTRAACRYFKEAYAKFGTWSMVAASYNMGMGGVQKQIGRQNGNDYYQLLLNEETARYVFRILAMKEIVNNADRYGFVIRPADLYEPIPVTTTTISTEIEDFAEFAAQNGINYKTLKLHNPWLRQNYLTNKNGKIYEIKLPA
ncbi:MAG: lytic transglycosylase domain-containing protein [Flavobacteriales bacterium]